VILLNFDAKPPPREIDACPTEIGSLETGSSTVHGHQHSPTLLAADAETLGKAQLRSLVTASNRTGRRPLMA